MASKYREDIQRGVESLINCLICTEPYKSPKVLPCQHTFCLPCLQRFYESYNQQRIIRSSNFQCPQCRKTCFLPQGGLDDLPNDFKVGQIQDVFDKIHISMEGKGINCDVCRYEFKRSKSESFCAQCSKYLCGSCTQNHAANTLFGNHTTLAIGAQSVESLICSEHKEEIKYYCTQCKIALCTVCALSKHSKHETLDVSQAMDQQRLKIQECVETLKSNLLSYEAKAEQLAVLKKDREKNAAEIKESIKAYVKEFISKVKDDEKRLSEELDKALKLTLKDADKEIESIHTAVKHTKAMCDNAESFLANGQSLDLINKFDKMMSKMKKFTSPPSTKLPDNITRAYKFIPNNEPSLGDLGYESNKGEESTSTSTSANKKTAIKKSKANDKLTNSNAIDVSLPPAKTSVTVTRSQSMKSTGSSPVMNKTNDDSTGSSGSGRSLSTSTAPGRMSPLRCSTPTRMSPLRCSTPTNSSPRPVTPTTESNSLRENGGVICGASSEYQKQTNPNEIKVKWKTMDNAHYRDIALLADGGVVTTEHKDTSDKLQIFDSGGNLKKAVSHSSQLVRPWGCSVNHQNGYIIVTDHGDRSVKVMDSDLSIRQVWRSIFDKPSGVAVMRTGEIVISDTGTKSYMCSIHSASGIRKREFATKGTSTGQLMTPNYILADHHDRIVVSDTTQQCIKIFDTKGKQLLRFGATADSPLKPHGICVDAQNNILIADQAYGGISLYSADGKFMQHIAKVPDLPWGVGIHDNGSLAIATDPSLYMYYVPMFKT